MNSNPTPTTTTQANTTPAQPAPTNNTGANTGGNAGIGQGNAMAVGPEMEPIVTQLMGMGFEREQVIQALRAAFFNPDRAVDYLLNVSDISSFRVSSKIC